MDWKWGQDDLSIGIQYFRENEYIGVLGGWWRWRRRNSTVDTSSVFSGMSTASYNPLYKNRIYSFKRKIVPKLRTLVGMPILRIRIFHTKEVEIKFAYFVWSFSLGRTVLIILFLYDSDRIWKTFRNRDCPKNSVSSS